MYGVGWLVVWLYNGLFELDFAAAAGWILGVFGHSVGPRIDRYECCGGCGGEWWVCTGGLGWYMVLGGVAVIS